MAQIYAAYLGRFVSRIPEVEEALLTFLRDSDLFDWQRMWMLGALNQVARTEDSSIRIAMNLLVDGNRHDALRAAAAIYVGRFGDPGRRNSLFSIYPNVSEYVQLAIYFSSRRWPTVERRNARLAWGSHGPLHKMMTAGIGAT